MDPIPQGAVPETGEITAIPTAIAAAGDVATAEHLLASSRPTPRWTTGSIETAVRERTPSPEHGIRAVLEVLDEILRSGPDGRDWFAEHLARPGDGAIDGCRLLVAKLAREAELSDPEEIGKSWRILAGGFVAAALEGDDEALPRANRLVDDLLSRYTPRDRGFIDDFDIEFATLDEPTPSRRRERDDDAARFADWEASAYLDWDELG